ncbi:MAG: chorismate-binding protein [Bacteroidia bacterium]
MTERRIISKELPENTGIGQLLQLAGTGDFFALLNSNSAEGNPIDPYHVYDYLIAIDIEEEIVAGEEYFKALKDTIQKGDWIFTLLSYDLKNRIEKLHSENFDGLKFPEAVLVRPQIVIAVKGRKAEFQVSRNVSDEKVENIFRQLSKNQSDHFIPFSANIKSRLSEDEYIGSVREIIAHIQRGDIYEMNYCMEFYSENATIDPIQTYLRLNKISPMPFSAYLHYRGNYLICASPERFLAGRNSKMISQPIKGTARRGKSESEDLLIVEKLRNDPKEKSENVMIVDLVRNDLSRTAKKRSVHVEELFGIKTYRQLHQMVSTIVSEKDDVYDISDVLQSAFPMGSMTGAPKVRAMEIIEEFEKSKRGWYSGSFGYITPDGDFDLNVIIRSILYNSENHYLSYTAGSAITIGSDPAKEYEECLLKARSFFTLAQ